MEQTKDGYILCISVDALALMEATTCDTVEAAIDQKFAWLRDSGIYLDTLKPIKGTC